MTRPYKWDWLHRDADGNGLMVGPNCPSCLVRAVAHYRCTLCPETWEVPGVFRWSWQGKAHWHDPDDAQGWRESVTAHWRSHGGRGMIVPVGEEGDF